jgi:hypothetical protein
VINSQIVSDVYVLGLSWRPLVARGDMGLLARKKVQEERAFWYTHKGKERVVGISGLSRKSAPPKGKSFLSAARIAAISAPYGTVFFALKLTGLDGAKDSDVWVCGLRDGQPINGFDAVVSDEQAPQTVQNFLSSLGISESDVEIRGDADGIPSGAIHQSWADLLDVNYEGAELTPSNFVLNKGHKILVVVAVLAAVAHLGYGEYKSRQVKKIAEQNRLLNSVDPKQSWDEAFAQWSAERVPSGFGPIEALRASIGEISLNTAGWALSKIECTRSGSKWSCTADYDRVDLHTDPTFVGFDQKKPAGWAAKLKGMDQIVASFSVDFGQGEQSQLLLVSHHAIHTVSALQLMSRAWVDIKLDEFKLVSIPAPTTPNGAAIQAPSEFKSPVKARFALGGPARSLDLPAVSNLPVAWDKAVFTFSDADPSLVNSAVMVNVSGDIYAIQ